MITKSKNLIQAQKSKGQNAKEPMKLTAIEKMLFAHLDESDDSSDEQNETIGGQNKVGGSVREEGLHADSNENSSVRGAPANSVVNGGRPQRKTKSKNEI